eukprot:gene7900-8754_t
MASAKQKQTEFENTDYLSSVIKASTPNTEEDLLVLIVHAVLLKNGFKVINKRNNEESSAFSPHDGLGMPDGWNRQADPDCYEFTYVDANNGRLYSLRALRIDDVMHIAFFGQDDDARNAMEVQINVCDEVRRGPKPITVDWFVNAARLWGHIQEKLLGNAKKMPPIEKCDTKTTEEQGENKQESEPILLERQPMHHAAAPNFPEPPLSSLYAQEQHVPRVSPFAYGDADRIPGYAGMGGMMMDPLRSGGMGLRPPMHPGVPRGAVPPGARFDPYGPMTEFDHRTGTRAPRRSFDPSPDHLRRPNFDDDMFM